MRIFAYCAASFAESVQRAAGVKPLLSPPLDAESFNPAWMEHHDLIYLKLHGMPDERFWYGDNWTTAMDAATVTQADLSEAIVFAANCHMLREDGEYSPMLQALFQAGARTVIGGPGKNYARQRSVFGADLLGMRFRQALERNLTIQRAFSLAKIVVALTMINNNTVRKDTLAFQLITPEAHNDRPHSI